jgi:heme/copper-type cytochrome/quinol oxidase subunit 1
MSNERNSPLQDYLLISRAAHVIERSGLAMAGAMCGMFVATQLAKANVALFDSVGFITTMILVGMIGFYLGIDIPRRQSDTAAKRPQVDPVELLSATGTFLAAVAALISVGAIVLDEMPSRAWEFAIGSWWLVGIVMQIGAGLVARLRVNRNAAA